MQVSGLRSGYGPIEVLKGIDLTVRRGELVTLLGRNGMGKSTLVKTIMGLVPLRQGELRFKSARMTGKAPHLIAQAGIGYVPEGRHIFPNLTVTENLVATHRKARGNEAWTLEAVFDLFPRLRERAGNGGNRLSGGEQQMLAIGRALMTNPDLLILDEATEGLAPLIRKEIWDCLAKLKTRQLSMIVIDKNLNALKRIADRHMVVSKGSIVWSGTSPEIETAMDTVNQFIGI